MQGFLSFALLSAALCWGTFAQAQPSGAPQPPDAAATAAAAPAGSTPSRWSAAIAFGLMGAPAYEGSDNWRAQPAFDLFARYGDALTLMTHGFDSIEARANLLSPFAVTALALGPMLATRPGRKQDSVPALHGMGDTDSGWDTGAFAAWRFNTEDEAALLWQRDIDNKLGNLAQLRLKHAYIQSPLLGRTAELSLAWADRDRMQGSFGVSDAQSLTTGMRAYDANGGFKSIGMELKSWRPLYEGAQTFSIQYGLAYDRLLDQAAYSPLVKDRGNPDQWKLGVMLRASLW